VIWASFPKALSTLNQLLHFDCKKVETLAGAIEVNCSRGRGSDEPALGGCAGNLVYEANTPRGRGASPTTVLESELHMI
jgi:hypothetical protein